MRAKRTKSEDEILNRIAPQLEKYEYTNIAIVDGITDRPDLLFNTDQGRLGIEITRLDYEGYCKWLNTPPEPPYSRQGEVTIDLTKMLTTVIDKKLKKYREYMRLRNLYECWLVLHNNVFEFKEVADKEGVADRKWFETNSQYELQDLGCPFDRVLFNLEHPDIWYSLFDKNNSVTRKTRVSRWPSIIYKESAVMATQPTVYTMDFTDSIPKDELK